MSREFIYWLVSIPILVVLDFGCVLPQQPLVGDAIALVLQPPIVLGLVLAAAVGLHSIELDDVEHELVRLHSIELVALVAGNAAGLVAMAGFEHVHALQCVALEWQHVELEERHVELARRHVELEERRVELERLRVELEVRQCDAVRKTDEIKRALFPIDSAI